jgi:hypothetical protein
MRAAWFHSYAHARVLYPGLACFLPRLRAVPTMLLRLLPAHMNAQLATRALDSALLNELR